jgi:PAS domain S-box-containing protein
VHLADRGGRTALLDQSLRVRLFSLGLERLLGWLRDEVEGRDWVDAFVPNEHRAVVEARLARALAGTLPSFESVAQTKDGRLLVLSLESTVIGGNEAPGLLVTAAHSRSLPPPQGDARCDDVVYVVDLAAGFGKLHAVRSVHAVGDRSWSLGEPCYKVLQGRDAPCDDCPLRLPADAPWPRTATRRVPGAPTTYEVISATKEGERARVHARRIPDEVLAAVHDAKLRALADDANLSEREREVLKYLLLGRALADIALILDISLRTVKFHQANVLEKLGVDSRSDLLRLIL